MHAFIHSFTKYLLREVEQFEQAVPRHDGAGVREDEAGYGRVNGPMWGMAPSAGTPEGLGSHLLWGNCPVEPSHRRSYHHMQACRKQGRVPGAWLKVHSVNVNWVEWMSSKPWASLLWTCSPSVKWAQWRQWDEVFRWTLWILTHLTNVSAETKKLPFSGYQTMPVFSLTFFYSKVRNVNYSSKYAFWSRRLNQTIFYFSGK